jgi:hypothetical protein
MYSPNRFGHRTCPVTAPVTSWVRKSGFIIPGKLSTSKAAKDACNSPYLGAHFGLGRSCEVDCKHIKHSHSAGRMRIRVA